MQTMQMGGGRRFSRDGMSGSIAGGMTRPDAGPGAQNEPGDDTPQMRQRVGAALGAGNGKPFLPNDGGASISPVGSSGIITTMGTGNGEVAPGFDFGGGSGDNNSAARITRARGRGGLGGSVGDARRIATAHPGNPANQRIVGLAPLSGSHIITTTQADVDARPAATAYNGVGSPAGTKSPAFSAYDVGKSPTLAPRKADQSTQDFLSGDVKAYQDSLSGQVKAFGDIAGDQFHQQVGSLLGDLNGIGALRSGAVETGVNDLMKTYGDRVGSYAAMTAGQGLTAAQGERDAARKTAQEDYEYGGNMAQRGSEYDRSLGANESQFGRNLTQRGSEYDRTQQQGESEFGRTLNQRTNEFGQDIGLRRDQFNAGEKDLDIERNFRDKAYGDAKNASTASAIGQLLGAGGASGALQKIIAGGGGEIGDIVGQLLSGDNINGILSAITGNGGSLGDLGNIFGNIMSGGGNIAGQLGPLLGQILGGAAPQGQMGGYDIGGMHFPSFSPNLSPAAAGGAPGYGSVGTSLPSSAKPTVADKMTNYLNKRIFRGKL